MNDSMKSTAALVVICAAAWGAWYGWQTWKLKQSVAALENIARSAALNKLLKNPPAVVKSSVDLAVRGINLQQGAKGRKTFDLKAEWATLNQESGAITVRDPDAHYMMAGAGRGNPPRVIHTTSKLGRIENGNQNISMSGGVKSVCEEKTLTGSSAVFLNEKRTLTYPRGGELASPDLSGTANRLVWNLNTNTIHGTNGVTMHWVPSSAADDNRENTGMPEGREAAAP